LVGIKDLMREYERARFPVNRRLDVHAEGPQVARERALHWIQSMAHERPGEELLLIVDRVAAGGRSASPVGAAIRELLQQLVGGLIDWWQPFAAGSIALRIASNPQMNTRIRSRNDDEDERAAAISGKVQPPPAVDIPPELLEMARGTAALRIFREELSIGLEDVILREVWIEAQTLAMERRMTFAEALDLVNREEKARTTDDAP